MSTSSVLFDAPGPKARRRDVIFGTIGSAVILAVLGLMVWTLANKSQFDSYKWQPFTTQSMWRDYLLPGLVGTLKAATLAIVISCAFGGLLAMLRLIEVPTGAGRRSTKGIVLLAIRCLASTWVEVTRAVPVLLMMLFAFGFLTAQGLISADSRPLIATVIGLIFYNSSVICEVIRSGIGQLPKGQREAGLAIGLAPGQTVRTILLSQAVTAMLPTLIGQLVVVTKDTALGYNVLYGELLYKSKPATAANSNIVAMLVVVTAIYITLNYTIGKFAELVEHHMKSRHGRSAEATAHDGDPSPGSAATPGLIGGPAATPGAG